MPRVKYIITGRSAQRDGQCVKCKDWVSASRSWEAILLQRAGTREWAVGHADCLGGKIGGVQKKWRGPDSITVTVK